MVTTKEILAWLSPKIELVHAKKVELKNVEVDFYDTFFEVHSEVLETIWVRTLEKNSIVG